MAVDAEKIRRDRLATEAAHAQVVAQLVQAQKDNKGQIAVMASVAAHAAVELKRWEAEPPSPTRDRFLYLYKLRKEIAEHGQEVLALFAEIDPGQTASVKRYRDRQAKTEKMIVLFQYLSMEYRIVNYRTTADAIDRALNQRTPTGNLGGGTGPIRPAGSGPLRTGSAPLRGSTSQLSPGTRPQAPGARIGSGPLPPLPPGAPGARPGTGSLALPGAPRVATGPLGSGTGPIPGTGSLALPAEPPLENTLRDAMAQPGAREAFAQVLNLFREIDREFQAFRDLQPQTQEFDPAELGAKLKKLSGNVYYLGRAVQALGPAAVHVTFETEAKDTSLEKFLADSQLRATSPQSSQPGGLVGKLKSMFKL